MKICFTVEELTERTEELKKNNKFTPGFDKMTPEALLPWLQINGNKLCAELNAGSYKPMPASGFFVAKFDGGYRSLVRLTALDAVIQKGLLDKIGDKCAELFSEYSFAYQKGKGTYTALLCYCDYAAEYPYVAGIDIKKCFDSIDYSVLERITAEVFADEKLCRLIAAEAKMPVIEDGRISERKKGLLQGAPLSGMLCNLYLDPLDKELEKQNIPFIRFADDIVLFAKTEKDAASFTETTAEYLSDKLLLETNTKKTQISRSEDKVFLGHKFMRDKTGAVTLHSGARRDAAYYDWFQSKSTNHRNSVDILSDGILRQKDFSAIFESETGSSQLPLETTERINIFSSVILDSGFLEKARQYGVYINVFDRHYSFIGRFVPSSKLRDQRLLFEQLTAYDHQKKRLELAKQFDLASVHNERLNIRYYNKQQPSDSYQRALDAIDSLYEQMKQCGTSEKLLMLEATVRSLYFSCFDRFVLESGFVFEKRSKRPPENEFNALISFGNVVLYNYIATEIYKSSLDIRVGFLHATNSREESLNLDIAEIFRPLIVDRVIFSLINRKELSPACFTEEENGAVYLTEEGKKIFLRAFYDKLSSTLTVRDQKYSYAMLIKEEINKLTRHFRGGETYSAYRQVR